MARKKPADSASVETATITAIKGFNADMTCQGFQFALGASYRHEGKVVCCPQFDQLARGEGGFHAIEGHPLEVFSYYPPATSRYATVELGGDLAREGSTDSKIACAEIRIGVEIHLPDLIQMAVKYVFDRVKWIDGAYASGEKEGVKSEKTGGAATASGDWGAATASGDWGAATASGHWGAATASGEQGAATASGRWGAATASGEQGAATASGDWGAATASGDWGAATASGRWGAATASGWGGAATASGTRGAATASGDWGAATASGDCGAATASGHWGAATASGTQGAATASGTRGAATASGFEGKARGKDGCALFLVERDSIGEILHVWAGIAGRDGIKPDTFYRLKAGNPVEAG